MRSLRTSIAVAWLVGIAPSLAGAQNLPPAKDLLRLRPILKGVEYEIPTEPAVIDACKVETVVVAKKPIGYALRDGQGKMLRKFVDSNGDTQMDQWSYYQDGYEVYRESDQNGDKSPDEARWLNQGGTRIAALTGGKVVGWKRISAEEASKVLVQALVAGDLGLLESVIATPEELEAIGVPKSVTEKSAAAIPQRAEQVKALQKGLTGWNGKTVWSRLDGMMPHLVPADAGLAQDVVVYENAVIFAAPPNGQQGAAKMAFLQAPDMVKLGEVWKFIELPRAVDPDKPLVSADGGLRMALARGGAGAVPAGGAQDPVMEAAIKELGKFNKDNEKLLAGGDKKDVARYHVGMIPLLRNVVKAAKHPDDQLVYNKQIVDSLAAAFQTGFYPKGLELLAVIVKEGGKIGSYAAFRMIGAEFAAKNEAGENPLVAQKKWMADLKAFVEKYPKADEAPDALFQLAQAHEFNAEEDEARTYFKQVVRDFPEADAAKKAAGALKRLDLVGKSIELRGPGLKGAEIDASTYHGKTLLVFFWATWAEPVKRDLPELNKLYEKHKGKGFEIVGVNLDNNRAELDEFLKATPLPWPQIHEPGGMESRLATEYGIISLPTMILVDPQGKVVNRSIRSANELDRQLEKVLTSKEAGVALGAK